MITQTLPQSPRETWDKIRSGAWRGVTSGAAPGYVQANLAILPRELAFDFLLFCQRNPKPCPLLEVIEAGEVEPSLTAPGADIRTDVPGYRIYRNGELTGEVDSLVSLWQDDLVSFLLGCSFSFEARARRRWHTASASGNELQRANVHHQHCNHPGGSIFRPDGGQYAAG